jgi:hypothetical protein
MMAAPLGLRIGPSKDEDRTRLPRARGTAFEESRYGDCTTMSDIRF